MRVKFKALDQPRLVEWYLKVQSIRFKVHSLECKQYFGRGHAAQALPDLCKENVLYGIPRYSRGRALNTPLSKDFFFF
jgi:hypothetical protein